LGRRFARTFAVARRTDGEGACWTHKPVVMGDDVVTVRAPAELTLTILSVAAAVVAGMSSMYLARAAKSLQRAPRIFLSYSHQDADTAALIANALRASGARVWQDEARVKPGVEIRPSLEKAITDSDALVALLSGTHSPWLTFEMGLARGAGLRFPSCWTKGRYHQISKTFDTSIFAIRQSAVSKSLSAR
jgi:hypothetical protein